MICRSVQQGLFTTLSKSTVKRYRSHDTCRNRSRDMILKIFCTPIRRFAAGSLGLSSTFVLLSAPRDSDVHQQLYHEIPNKAISLFTKLYNEIRFCTKMTLKLVQLVLLFLPTTIVLLLSKTRLVSHDSACKILRKALVYAGPCWVKLGQWAATRSDMFSREMCDNLSSLHSYVYTHSWRDTQVLMSSQLPGYTEWLQLDKNSVNSGAVAQVYRGVMKRQDETEVEVAVKVLHPDIRGDVAQDLYLISQGAWLLEYIPGVKWLAPSRAVQTFSETMLQQLDLTTEHRNLEIFRKNFADFPNVVFPTPYFSTKDVLVESFEDCLPLSFIARTGPLETRKKLAVTGIRMFLKMVFQDNFIHGDLHPGNILGSRDHRSDHVTVLDAGMTVTLRSSQQAMFYPLFKAFLTQNYQHVSRLLLKDAPVNNCKNEDLFVEEMSELVRNVAVSRIKLRELNVSGLMGDFFRLLRKHEVQLESNFISVIVSVLVMEGLGRSLDPELDILAEAMKLKLSL